MCALVQIPPGANFLPFFFSLPVMLGRQSTYIHQQHSMGDAAYVGSRLQDLYIQAPSHSQMYALRISIMTLYWA